MSTGFPLELIGNILPVNCFIYQLSTGFVEIGNILRIWFHFYSKCINFVKISNILPMNLRKIGSIITERRGFLQLRQEDLAEMSGVAIKTIHLIESGQGNPSISTLEKIATVLGLELLLQTKNIN